MQNHLRFRAIAVLTMITPLMAAAADADQSIDFVAHVKPILAQRCVSCHHTGAWFGELSLENRAHAFQKRKAGPAIVVRKPLESPLFRVLSLPEGDRKAMPPSGHRIPDEDKATIRRWIEQGAKWPKGPAGVIQPPAPEKSRGA